jgi:hypothetical protein
LRHRRARRRPSGSLAFRGVGLLLNAGDGLPKASATLVVEARDLDTDERSRATFAVPAVSTSDEERAQLAEAAAAVHPSAKMRSFADGAATFLDRQHLIVAFYVERPAGSKNGASHRDVVQERLFA